MRDSDEILKHHKVRLIEMDDWGDFACEVQRQIGAPLRVICSTGQGWDHVSVSRKSKIPTYEDMKFIKRLFFKDDEWAIEYHAPVDKHINVHNNVLHLWRPTEENLPIPPNWMV